ncbi:MAG: hypothetical protein MUF00_07570 [Gemmatimonadaceae bacterium]|jgi:hypothetical protein|nr:hypothetical protein [Gemmatimonadaceae bacterium]
MARPFLLVFRVGTTIMALVFVLNWVVAPGTLTLENAREWDVEWHSLTRRPSGRTTLLLSNASGRRVMVNCAHYATLCVHVTTRGTERLRVWTAELGYFASTSLLQARVAERDLVTLASQQTAYDGRALARNAPLVLFVTLAIVAWRWPRRRKRR